MDRILTGIVVLVFSLPVVWLSLRMLLGSLKSIRSLLSEPPNGDTGKSSENKLKLALRTLLAFLTVLVASAIAFDGFVSLAYGFGLMGAR